MSRILPWKDRERGGALAPRREHPLEQLRNEFDAFFDRLWRGFLSPSGEADVTPTRVWDFDVAEGDNEIVVTAELPGFEAGDLDVQLNNNVLTIWAQKQQTERGQSQRSFRRTVTLPGGINPDEVQAIYRNGVLELRMPKTEESRGKRIPIEGHSAGTQSVTRQPEATTLQGEEG
jgi:HSP20 family protein